MAATVIQHDLHAVARSCGRVHQAAALAGAGAPGTVTYGISLQAWCAYLMAAHVIPVHRCVELIVALTGAKPSPGFVHGLLARAAAAVRHANQLIRALIITASVICAHETPIRAGPGPKKTRKRYLLVACTNLLTYYFLGDRSLASFEAFVAFVFPDLTGMAVHDRYQNYDKFPRVTHQLCAAHYPDIVVMPIPDGPALAGGGDRGRDIGIITGLRGRPAAGQAAGSGRAGLLAGWSGRGLAA
jgi:hypothetical protein